MRTASLNEHNGSRAQMRVVLVTSSSRRRERQTPLIEHVTGVASAVSLFALPIESSTAQCILAALCIDVGGPPRPPASV
jgi:hypothetical protein